MRKLIATALALCIGMALSAAVKQYGVKVVAEYPHDSKAYTQGLFWQDGIFYESCGQYGESSFRIVDLKSGKATRRLNFNGKYFVEGSCIFKGKLYILTWRERVVFTYDPKTLKHLKTHSYPREGWGLTTDGKSLIASDGSDRLFYMDADLKVQKTVNVRMNGRPVRYLNELEWIGGRIWANVYTTNTIVMINPASGQVEGIINCKGLLPDSLRDSSTDVLNGIAINPSNGRIYLTGKNWKRLFEIQLVEKK